MLPFGSKLAAAGALVANASVVRNAPKSVSTCYNVNQADYYRNESKKSVTAYFFAIMY